jgi:dolichol-phosphate mannosyltransferase
MATAVATAEAIAVIIPTYNESDNIEALTEEIMALRLGPSKSSGGTSGQALGDVAGAIAIIIVDDNSPDGTGEIADELTRAYRSIKVIHRPAKLGLGSAHIAGFREALALGADHILTMDADFSHHPRYIPDLLGKNRDAQLVIGSRYVDEGGTLNWGLQRQILSTGANTFARLVLGLKAHDCTGAFRCYRREVLESIELDEIFSDGYSFLIEVLYKCQQRGWKIGEVPIIFEDRRYGTSKISRREIFKALYTVLCLGWKRVFSRGQSKEDDCNLLA